MLRNGTIIASAGNFAGGNPGVFVKKTAAPDVRGPAPLYRTAKEKAGSKKPPFESDMVEA
jgi:hypothetical protein